MIIRKSQAEIELMAAAQRPVRTADRWRGFGGTGRFPRER